MPGPIRVRGSAARRSWRQCWLDNVKVLCRQAGMHLSDDDEDLPGPWIRFGWFTSTDWMALRFLKRPWSSASDFASHRPSWTAQGSAWLKTRHGSGSWHLSGGCSDPGQRCSHGAQYSCPGFDAVRPRWASGRGCVHGGGTAPLCCRHERRNRRGGSACAVGRASVPSASRTPPDPGLYRPRRRA